PEADQRRRHAQARELLAQHPGLLAREAAATVLARPLGRREAALRAGVEPALRVRIGPLRLAAAPDALELAAHRAAQRLRSVPLEPGDQLFAEALGIGGGIGQGDLLGGLDGSRSRRRRRAPRMPAARPFARLAAIH